MIILGLASAEPVVSRPLRPRGVWLAWAAIFSAKERLKLAIFFSYSSFISGAKPSKFALALLAALSQSAAVLLYWSFNPADKFSQVMGSSPSCAGKAALYSE